MVQVLNLKIRHPLCSTFSFSYLLSPFLIEGYLCWPTQSVPSQVSGGECIKLDTSLYGSGVQTT